MSKYAVKTLYPDGVESPYRAVALPMFASLCLTVGALLVIFWTWGEVPAPLWKLLLALVTGYAFAVLGHRLGRRHMAFQLLRLVPWIPAALMPSACARGIVAWLSMLHLRWNLLHDGSARLYQSGASAFDERAAVFVGTVLIAQAAQLLVVHRCRLLTIGMCILWMSVGLATGGFSPVGAALLLAGTLAVCVSDISLHLTPAAWRTLSILLSLLVLAAFLPDMDMPFVQGLREDAKQQVHKLRYGEETQPDGELAKAAMLHSDSHVMLYVTSGQEKTLYLRGYTAGVYEDGAWVPLHGMAYTGDYSGMMRWLKKASPEDRARWTAWWGEKLLAARGIDASLGWHTDETDAKLASMIDSVNPGEYRRVCQLLEKAIYGGIELKSYEERTIRSLLERVRFAPMPDLTTRMRVHCLFLNHLRRCHRKK